MRAEIVAVGTELLLGQTLNTNSSFLSRRLAGLGISLYRHTTVGDNMQRMRSAIRDALDLNDVVFTTGGLGPTVDDLTKECVADIFKLEMVQDAETLHGMHEFFEARGRQMTENNLRQTFFPRGSVILKNPRGTAPGCIVSSGEKAVVLLPGPPFEMEPMFDESVVPWLSTKLDAFIRSRTIHMCGIGESEMETRVRDLIDSCENPTIAPYAKRGECLLRVTARARSEQECEALIAPVAGQIYERLGEFIYGENTSIEKTLVELLQANKLTLALAESCTGGMLSSQIVSVPGASDVLVHSCVVYSNHAKMKILNVSGNTLEQYGAVSEACVREMAAAARILGDADIGLAVSGIAGPGGGSEEKPVGLVHFAYDYKGFVQAEHKLLPGDRESVRQRTAMTAMAKLIRIIKENSA